MSPSKPLDNTEPRIVIMFGPSRVRTRLTDDESLGCKPKIVRRQLVRQHDLLLDGPPWGFIRVPCLRRGGIVVLWGFLGQRLLASEFRDQ